MANPVLLIVPSRERPEKSVEFFNCFTQTSRVTDLIFGLDDDDVEYPRLPGVIYEKSPRSSSTGTLNAIATKYASQYKYLAVMGDDNRIRTADWDIKLIAAIAGQPFGVAYGNDLLQGQNLPTAVLMDADIVATLGFIAPPKLKHLYADNFWKELGLALNTLKYLDDVIIEHMHFSANKSEMDASYARTNSGETGAHDRREFDAYMAEHFQNDVNKLRKKIAV
jgi:hypothetical protein